MEVKTRTGDKSPKKTPRFKSKMFSEAETFLLLKLIKSEPILISKQVDGETVHGKKQAWERVAEKFNLDGCSQHRGDENLKNKFETMKKNLRAKLVASKHGIHEVLESYEQTLFEIMGIGSSRVIVVSSNKSGNEETADITSIGNHGKKGKVGTRITNCKTPTMKADVTVPSLTESLKPYLEYGEIETLDSDDEEFNNIQPTDDNRLAIRPQLVAGQTGSPTKRERLILPRPSCLYMTSVIVPAKKGKSAVSNDRFMTKNKLRDKKGKKRTPNFSNSETKRLLELVKAEPAISSKKQDNRSLLEKRIAWNRVALTLSHGHGSAYRDPETVRCKYENLKKSWKMRKIRLEKRGEDVTEENASASGILFDAESGLLHEHDYSVAQPENDDGERVDYRFEDFTAEVLMQDQQDTLDVTDETNHTDDDYEELEHEQDDGEEEEIMTHKMSKGNVSLKQRRRRVVDDISAFAAKKSILLAAQQEAVILDRANKERQHGILALEMEIKEKELELINNRLRNLEETHMLEMEILHKKLKSNS